MSQTSERPGAVKCTSCGHIAEYKTMRKVQRRWYCTKKSNDEEKDGCVERMEKYGIWPPN